MKNKKSLKININTNILSENSHQKNNSLNYLLVPKKLISEISNDQLKLKKKYFYKQKISLKNNYISKVSTNTSNQASISDNSKILNQVSSYRTNTSFNKQQNDVLILKHKNLQNKNNLINFNRKKTSPQLNHINSIIPKTKEKNKINITKKSELDFNYPKPKTTRKFSTNNNSLINNLNNNSMVTMHLTDFKMKNTKNYTIKRKSKILLAKLCNLMNKPKNYHNNQLILTNSNILGKKNYHLGRALTGTDFNNINLNINKSNNDFSHIKNFKKVSKKKYHKKYDYNKNNGLNIKIYTSFLNKFLHQKKHLLTEIGKKISPSYFPHSKAGIYCSLNKLNDINNDDNINQDEFNSKETKDNTIFNQSCNATKIKYTRTNESLFFENNKTNFESPEDVHFFYVSMLQHGKDLNEKF